MNKQAIFDRIAKHLLKQNRKSMTPLCNDDDGEADEPSCAYRAYDPAEKRVLKCAIGCLIPFGRYHPEIEGMNVYGQEVRQALPVSLHIDITPYSPDITFLGDLQEIHDHFEPADWPYQLSEFACMNDLDTAVLEL